GLADPGLAAHVDHLPGARLETAPEDAVELGEFGAPADEGPAAGLGFVAQARQTPGGNRLAQSLDLERAGGVAHEALRQQAAHRVRDEDLAAPRAVREPRSEVHRIPGH